MGAVRLMVVDDAADTRFLIDAILEDSGADVRVVAEAADAQAALEAIDGADPDVVILDAKMPRVDGFQAAGLIRERRPGQRILLCTSHVDAEVEARARAVGAGAVLSKADLAGLPAAVLRLAGR